MSGETVWDVENPLDRIPGESVKANEALRDYWLLGGGRSLRKLLELYLQQVANGGPMKAPPTTKWNTLSSWSLKRHWQARIGAHKEIEDAMELERYRARHMSPAEVVSRLSDQARADMADFADVRTQADLKALEQSGLVKKITAHYRQMEDGRVTGRITIDLHDAQKALELLAKHYGLLTDNVHIEGGVDVKGYTVVSPDDWEEPQGSGGAGEQVGD